MLRTNNTPGNLKLPTEYPHREDRLQKPKHNLEDNIQVDLKNVG
jgi:hypothetical protein